MSSSSPADDLLMQALALPDGDRIRLAGKLLASVSPPGGLSVDDEDFEDVLERRSQELRDGTVKGISADEVILSIRRSLEERRRR
jgi:putative addiction module component (TIGR02574 family)